MSIADLNDWLTGSSTSAKFETPGDTITGSIVSAEKRQETDFTTGEPKYFKSGEPINMLVIELQTTLKADADDDGKRTLWARHRMLDAIKKAIRASRSTFEIGGVLTVTYTGDGEPAARGISGPKLYEASYTPAKTAGVNELLNEPAPAAAPAAAPGQIDVSKLDAAQLESLRALGVIQ